MRPTLLGADVRDMLTVRRDAGNPRTWTPRTVHTQPHTTTHTRARAPIKYARVFAEARPRWRAKW